MEKILSTVEIGKTFKIADIEFIAFPGNDGEVIGVAKDIAFFSDFGNDNNFAKSKILKRLQTEVLPKIETAVGAENVLEFETDLLSLDGSKKHGVLKSKISIPTFDFYRANVKIFDEYKLDEWWWTATPDSTSEHINDRWITCVSPSGDVGFHDCFDNNRGVRPFLHFVSSISVSCEE